MAPPAARQRVQLGADAFFFRGTLWEIVEELRIHRWLKHGEVKFHGDWDWLDNDVQKLTLKVFKSEIMVFYGDIMGDKVI